MEPSLQIPQPQPAPIAMNTPSQPASAPASPQGSNGGLLVGASHDNGGIKFIIAATGQRIEAEGGEYVLCEAAMSSTDMLSLKGTPMQIAKKLAELYHCNTGAVTPGTGLQAGQYVLCNAATQEPGVIEVKGTVRDIINQIATSVKCNGVDVKGQAAPAPQPQPVMAQGGAVPAGPVIPEWLFYLRYHPIGLCYCA